MKNKMESRVSEDSRRGFFQRCLGAGAVLAAAPPGHAGALGVLDHLHRAEASAPGLEEYERIMGRTGLMDVVGRPRSWSVVSRGFHPFCPERIVVLPSRGGYEDRCGLRARRRIDGKIDELIEESRRLNPGYDPPGGWFPDSKRESIYRIMDAMTDHYGDRSRFEAWVVGLAWRELLGSTAWRGCGMAHQFQHDGGEVPVDCPPVDWWLFLFPGGIGWSALDDEPVFAVIGHVARDGEHARSGSGMLPTWALAERVWNAVDRDWARVARLGRVEAAWHLNPLVARLLDTLSD